MMRRIDQETSPFFKFTIFGESGTGKTTLGTTAPSPLFLLSERQGMNSIKEAAQRAGEAIPPVLFMEKMVDYRDVLRALHGDKEKPFKVLKTIVEKDDKGKKKERFETMYEGPWPETVVIDSITDALNKLYGELVVEAPPPVQKDGLREMQMRHWGALRTRCEKLIRLFRDVPLHVVYLALKESREATESSEPFTGPDLPMKALPGVLLGCVNVSGMTRRDTVPKIDSDGNPVVKDGKPMRTYEFSVQTRGPNYISIKAPMALNAYETPNISEWIEKLTK